MPPTMTPPDKLPYDPRFFRALTFFDHLAAFEAGEDTPRAYLERCLETLEAREPDVQAFAALNLDGARAAADASTSRWRAGQAIGPIDGLPIGIKDLIETKDMPTGLGCPALKDNFPKKDNAGVWALREAGAVILGKTVTAELGNREPGPTRNPFDPTRTPGGSSSGSAAAVAARMVPAAIGTQVGGSIVRPASFCGNVALKPTQGAINRGDRQYLSQSTHGVHAGCLEDMWAVMQEMARRVGGDPGTRGLIGPRTLPEARMPEALIVLETQGWEATDGASKQAFEDMLKQLSGAGVTLIRREDAMDVEALEQCLADGDALSNAITRWEARWLYRWVADMGPNALSQRNLKVLVKAEAMTPKDYREALHLREVAQEAHARAGALADAVITLSSPGPAPVSPEDTPGEPLAPQPTGWAAFNYPASLLFAPSLSLPLMAIEGLPVGVQLMGLPGTDADVTAIGRWLQGAVSPVIA